MKLNLDCVRAVLLQIEMLPFNEQIAFKNLCANLTEYTKDDVSYSCIKLKEAGYIEATITHSDTAQIVLRISDITFSGHQFLANIRENKIWNGTKAICEQIGSKSLDAVAAVATNIVTALIKQHFGIIF